MPGERQLLRPIVLGSLVLPLVGVYGLALSSNPRYWVHANVLTWYAVMLALALEWVLRRGRRGELFLTIATLHLFVLTPEIYLRLTGFRYESGVQFGYPRPEQWIRFEPHESLFWTLPPGQDGVNARGFRAPELSETDDDRSADDPSLRVVVLGDSVPHQGYPALVETLLAGRSPRLRDVQVFDWSLPGYSSHQGRVLAELHAGSWAAAVGVISYGWNDHWLAWGSIDAEKSPSLGEGGLGKAIYRRSRLLQGARRLAAPWWGVSRPSSAYRVPLEHYRQNLERIGSTLTTAGTLPLWVTPPTSHPRLGVPDYLTERHFAIDAASVVELHRTYNRVVREVATDRGWPLLDLERRLESRDDLEEIFLSDGIHLTPRGSALVAHEIATAILELIDAES